MKAPGASAAQHGATVGREYIRVPLCALEPTDRSGFDLYLAGRAGEAPRLYCARDYPLKRSDLNKLYADGVQFLCVSQVAYAAFQSYLHDKLEGLLAAQHIESLQRFAVLQTWTRLALEDTCSAVDAGRIVQQTQEVGEKLVGFMSNEQLPLAGLFNVLEHDYLTFAHLLNVATYATLLAQGLGIQDQETLKRIAVGGLLHDIGKRTIPLGILNKPGPLTPEERAIVQCHPQDGYVELCARDDLEWDQLMMVYQHHERHAGGGYPTGVSAGDIHRCARLCAVVDVFDAVTGRRPYRRPMSRHEAMQYIASRAGTSFDPEMVRCWMNLMARR